MAIRKQELYKENDPLVDRLLNDMIYLPIKGVGKLTRYSNLICH